MMKRVFSLLLALVMALSLLSVPAAAAEDRLVSSVKEYAGFSDVTGTWCESYVETVYEAGLMEGKSADCFDPNGTLTEAQRLVIGVRLHALLHGGTVEQAAPGEAWWLPAARYYLAADGNTTDDPAQFAEFAGTPASRLSFALQMVWSTPAEALPAVNAVEEVPDFTEDHWTDDSLRQDVLTLYRAGILNGVDQWGRFDPRGTLTRGQAAAMLARVIAPSLRLRFDLPAFDLCRDVFGWDPQATVLTVGNTAVSAEVFALPLAEALRIWPSGYLDTALAKTSIQMDIAAEVLCAQKGLSLDSVVNREDISPASVRSGVSLSAAVWRGEHDTLLALLAFQYDPDLVAFLPGLPGSPSLSSYPDAMEQALEETRAQLPVTVSPLLAGLDLDGAQARLLASPYCY